MEVSRFWKELMSKPEFVIFMNFVRIGTLIMCAIIIYILIKEITAVKLLAYDPCAICVNKTGATCTLFDPFAVK